MTKESTNNRRARQSAVPLEERQPLDGRRTTEPAGDEGWDLDPVAVSAEYASMVSRQLALLGEDPAREGLLKTPTRVANIRDTIVHEFEVAPERCERDLFNFLQQLADQELIEIKDGIDP